MLQIRLHHEQERDEQQEHDQYTVRAFVVLAVQGFVFPIDEHCGDDECDDETHREDKLPLCKHCGYFSGKGSQSLPKFGYFATS